MKAHEMIIEMIDEFKLSMMYIAEKLKVNRSTVYRWYKADIVRIFGDNVQAIKLLYRIEKQKAKRINLV